MNHLPTEVSITCIPRNPFTDDPRRKDQDSPGRRQVDESSTPLPGETDYSDDDDDKDSGQTTNDN